MAGAVSLRPSDAVQGGLINDVVVEVKESKFALWDYNGSVPQAVPALCWVMGVEEGEDVPQYWSMGSPKDWVPSDDGKSLVPVGTSAALKTNSNGMMLLKSVVDSGFPEDKIGSDASVFAGMVCHVIRAAAPKRAGLEKRERADGKEYEQTVLVVDRIDKFPWEAAKAKGAPKGAGAAVAGKPAGAGAGAGGGAKAASPATGAGAAGAEDVRALAVETIVGILAEAGGTIAKTALPTATFKKLIGNPLQQKVVAMVSKVDFLESGEGGWTYADGQLTFG